MRVRAFKAEELVKGWRLCRSRHGTLKARARIIWAMRHVVAMRCEDRRWDKIVGRSAVARLVEVQRNVPMVSEIRALIQLRRLSTAGGPVQSLLPFHVLLEFGPAILVPILTITSSALL